MSCFQLIGPNSLSTIEKIDHIYNLPKNTYRPNNHSIVDNVYIYDKNKRKIQTLSQNYIKGVTLTK